MTSLATLRKSSLFLRPASSFFLINGVTGLTTRKQKRFSSIPSDAHRESDGKHASKKCDPYEQGGRPLSAEQVSAMLAQVCTVDNLKDICNFQRFFSCADALKFYESYMYFPDPKLVVGRQFPYSRENMAFEGLHLMPAINADCRKMHQLTSTVQDLLSSSEFVQRVAILSQNGVSPFPRKCPC